MTSIKKEPLDAKAIYKLKAALLRAEVAATRVRLDREVLPVDGWIRVVLSGKGIPRDQQETLFGPSSIDIPEFREARKKMG